MRDIDYLEKSSLKDEPTTRKTLFVCLYPFSSPVARGVLNDNTTGMAGLLREHVHTNNIVSKELQASMNFSGFSENGNIGSHVNTHHSGERNSEGHAISDNSAKSYHARSDLPNHCDLGMGQNPYLPSRYPRCELCCHLIRRRLVCRPVRMKPMSLPSCALLAHAEGQASQRPCRLR
jgi:hypothetical protein